MKNRALRFLGFVLSVFVLLSVFSGCGEKGVSEGPSQGTETAKQDTPSAGQTQEDKNAMDTSPITLTAYLDHPQLMQSNWGEDDVSKFITEKSGVTLDVQYATNGDGSELQLKIASGDTLPDFVVTGANSNTADLLFKEKKVQPLNKVAEEYFPKFMEYLPKGMAEVYSREDGNLYCVVDWFGDAEKLAEAKVGKQINQDIVINKPIWDALGNPAMETLEDLKNVLKSVKSKFPDITFPIFGTFNNVTGDKDGVNLIYRLFGGKDVLYLDGENKIRLCASAPAYKDALMYLNTLYREKVFNPEIFTLTEEQSKAVLQDSKLFAYAGQGFSWMSNVKDGLTDKSICYPVDLPTAPGISRDQIQLKDFSLGIGGWHGTHISTDSKNLKRALQYIAFRYTDEMQIAERYGIEGRGWVRTDDGTLEYSELKGQMEAEKGFEGMSAILGVNNWNHSWFTTNWVVAYAEHNRLKQMPPFYREYEINAPYAKNERVFELARRITNEDMKVKYEQMMMVWNEAVPKMILSNTEAGFNEEYDKFLKAVDAAGIKDVEAFIQGQYNNWKQKLGE